MLWPSQMQPFKPSYIFSGEDFKISILNLYIDKWNILLCIRHIWFRLNIDSFLRILSIVSIFTRVNGNYSYASYNYQTLLSTNGTAVPMFLRPCFVTICTNLCLFYLDTSVPVAVYHDQYWCNIWHNLWHTCMAHLVRKERC